MRLPLVGQIVLFNQSDGKQLPAIITKVYGDYQGEADIALDLVVFNTALDCGSAPSFGVNHGNGLGQWQWPDIAQ